LQALQRGPVVLESVLLTCARVSTGNAQHSLLSRA
jgi:hypothetical protein